MIFDMFYEAWIVEGHILYASVESIGADSADELVRMIEDGEVKMFNGFELNMVQKIDEDEVRVEFFMPFHLTHQYHFIAHNEAEKRKEIDFIANNVS